MDLRSPDEVRSLSFRSPSETKPAKLRRIPIPVALLIAANALTQFAIQAWLAYGFADKVWKLRQPLPWFAPVALDVFAVTMMVLTYHLRNAPLRTRAYAWFWLAVAIASQVGASEGYADHADWSAWGRAASVLPAVFLAASLHALIIVARRREQQAELMAEPTGPSWWQHRRAARLLAATVRAERRAAARTPRPVFIKPRPSADPTPTPVTQVSAWVTVHRAESVPPLVELPAAPPTPAPAEPEPAPTETPVTSENVAPPKPQPTQRRRRPAAAPRAGDQRRAEVIRRCLDAAEPEDIASVARELGMPVPRTAQLWVKKERQHRDAQRLDLKTPSLGPLPPMTKLNGHDLTQSNRRRRADAP